VAPTASLSAPATVNEGSAFSVALTNPVDPSNADMAAGFHYAFAVDGASLDGTTSANSGTVASQSFTFDDGPSDHTLTERIFDKDRGSTHFPYTTHFRTVAPTASLSAPATVNEGSAFSVALTNPVDPSNADAAAGFHYTFAVDGAS